MNKFLAPLAIAILAALALGAPGTAQVPGIMRTNGATTFNSLGGTTTQSITTTPTVLTTYSGTSLGTAQAQIKIVNESSVDVLFGQSTTTANILDVAPAGGVTYLPYGPNVTLYTWVASGNPTISITQVGY